ncbi:uncharacterized protein ARMOST_15184 [Armillaria ostoyae]|uniref:Uncharacterized protein n=1 Tax=Armillaria ostoyae TaxID=47428 RepID=A0A284RSU4_ARMOS|nr:uncharacterized protein ARMOST_15184 [Armillaria ostoyae]
MSLNTPYKSLKKSFFDFSSPAYSQFEFGPSISSAFSWRHMEFKTSLPIVMEDETLAEEQEVDKLLLGSSQSSEPVIDKAEDYSSKVPSTVHSPTSPPWPPIDSSSLGSDGEEDD